MPRMATFIQKVDMQIGNIVHTPKGTGKLVALFDSQFFLTQVAHHDPSAAWGERHPNWPEKLVALVSFFKPIKISTLEEWQEDGLRRGFSAEESTRSYHRCPEKYNIAFPLDDLILP